MNRRAAAGAAFALAFALPAAASDAKDPKSYSVVMDAERELWQTRFLEAREAVAKARARRQTAVEEYRRLRHRRRKRGEEKQKGFDEFTASEAALERADAALEDLFETARRAGVPRGWMRLRGGDVPAAPESEPEGP